MTMIIGGVALTSVCPGAEFTTGHIVLDRPNGSMVISYAELCEPDAIYVHLAIKAGGTQAVEEDEYVEHIFPRNAPTTANEINDLVNYFEMLAK